MSIELKKKASFNKPLGGDVFFQLDGRELSVKALKDQAMAAAAANPDTAGVRINSLDVYVKPAENMGYYVARHGKGEITGSFSLVE